MGCCVTAFPNRSEAAAVKGRLRAAVLAARRSAPVAVREASDAALRASLTGLVRRIRPRTVAAYAPTDFEPGGVDLPEVLAGAGVPRLLLPVLRDDLDLDWAEYSGPDSLAPAGRGLREPRSPRLGVAAVATADLVVVPALGVDSYGVRLGRGGGSYDRALARVPGSALVTGLIYDGELVDRLPAEPHDRPVDAAITPGEAIVYLPTPAGRAGRG